MDKDDILAVRFKTLDKHYQALKGYHGAITNLLNEKNIYDVLVFESLKIEERAILEAYLKRFSSIQDFLGNKIFPAMLSAAGVNIVAMSKILYYIEKEGIIDDFEVWIALRNARNELEHDYPEHLKEALNNLKFCIDNFITIEKYYVNSVNFVGKH